MVTCASASGARKRATVSIGLTVADRPMRCGRGPPAFCDEIVEPRQRQRQMRAALVVGHGVNLVDDDGADVSQRQPAALGGQQNEQRLRRRHQDVRRMLQHLLPLRRPACRRCGPPCGSPAASGRVPRPAPRFPPAAHRGSCGCRCSAPSAAKRRRPAWCPEGCPRGRRARDRRGRSGTPRASCPIRSAPKSARARPSGWPATRALRLRWLAEPLRQTSRETSGLKGGQRQEVRPYLADARFPLRVA